MTNTITTIGLPDYNEKTDRIYSIIFMNIITLGGCSLIALFGLDDIILCLLFWFQIIAANNNQGFLNKVYNFTWRVIDIVGAFTIFWYVHKYYINVIPKLLRYPFYVILSISAYSQSVSKSMSDYIRLVNIWHLLGFFLIIMIIFFKYPHSFTNSYIILAKDIQTKYPIKVID